MRPLRLNKQFGFHPSVTIKPYRITIVFDGWYNAGRMAYTSMMKLDQDPVRGRAIGGGVRLVGRQALALIGLVLVILSIPIGFLTPLIPIGLPIGIFGAALLARNSVWGQRLILHLIKRNPRLERITPSWLKKLIVGSEHRG